MAACSSNARKSDVPPDNKPDGPAEKRTAISKSGNATRFDVESGKNQLWSIEWKSAELQYDEDGKFGGSMVGVQGEFFRKGAVASRFKAGKAAAKFGSNALAIDGGVEVKATEPKGTLKAARIIWNPDKDRIEASGKVTVETEKYTLGPFEALFASPNLDEVGTPDMFRKLK